MRSSLAGLACAVLLGAAAPAPAPFHYTIDTANSEVAAKVSIFGLSSATVHFPKIKGDINFDPDRPEDATVEVEVDATASTSTDSNVESRIQGEDFFWVERYPTITFAGRGMRLEGERGATITGTLTARGVSRPATLAMEVSQPVTRANAPPAVDLEGRTTINRRDFGMTAYPLIVGEKVVITIKARIAMN